MLRVLYAVVHPSKTVEDEARPRQKARGRGKDEAAENCLKVRRGIRHWLKLGS